MPLTFGRCTGCLAPATMRDGQWWHDPGGACGVDTATFSPVPPFDPIGGSWSISDPQAVLDDLPDMPASVAASAGRELLRRYETPFAEVGAIDLGTLLAYARRIRHGADDNVEFTGPAVSSDYAPDNIDASDVDGTESDEWESQPLLQRSSGRRPRSATAVLPTVSTSPEPDEDEEEDYGPSPLSL